MAGWTGRIDPQATKAGRNMSEAKFVGMGTGFHVTSGPAAVYWNPANTAKGNYTDGKPALVNFQVQHGTYVVPKVLERGYLALGAAKLAFDLRER